MKHSVLKYLFSLLTLLSLSSQAFAARGQQAWISDQQRIPVYQDTSTNRRYLGQVNSGDVVQILEQKEEYAKIRAGELTGWVNRRYLSDQPSIHSQYTQQQKILNDLQKEHENLKAEHQSALNQLSQLQSALNGLQNDEQKARDQLVALEKVSGNVMAIDRRNRELETSIAQVEQENLTLRHKNTRLEESLKEKQMMTGGLLVMMGVVLNWLFGNVLNRRKYRDFY
ncbi:MAG: TIGR04211 family SH3 domain-containing protein [Cardiobacteriaceae bacterium]|nr:TIGR04211 family SH3 domain-containing protein [Cardiobacteriaceae bacterium]